MIAIIITNITITTMITKLVLNIYRALCREANWVMFCSALYKYKK